MALAIPTTIISHWNTMIDELQASSQDFYRALEEGLSQRQIPDTNLSRVNLRQGGIFAGKREYLQVRRGPHIFHVCAAPFGSGFFVSWWLGEIDRGFFAWLSRIPLVGLWFRLLIRPITYYRIDTALMFQSATHTAVLEVVDSLTTNEGIRGLTELERRPVSRDFFSQ